MVRLSLTLAARHGEANGLLKALRLIMGRAQNARGCLGTQLALDVANRDLIHYAEDWASEPELRVDIRSERFHHLFGVMEAAAEPPRFDVLVGTRIPGLEFVESALRSSQR